MVSVLEKEYKRAYSAYEKAQQALEETEKKKIYASLQSGDEAVMAPLEKEASHREKSLQMPASVLLSSKKARAGKKPTCSLDGKKGWGAG